LLLCFFGTWLAGSFLTAPANQTIGNLPSDIAGSSVQFSSESGSTIHGWFIPGKKGMGAIALMHGVRANRLSMLDRARFLSHAGYTVLLFDFHAHGESEGKHITFGYLESKDAQAAVSFLRSNAPGEKIGLIGVSMGGASALLASPPLDVNAMVLEMVYPSIKQAISNRLSMRLGGWAKVLTPFLSW
jgi:alpha-beta hydrolase superfamily lysophospholipase